VSTWRRASRVHPARTCTRADLLGFKPVQRILPGLLLRRALLTHRLILASPPARQLVLSGERRHGTETLKCRVKPVFRGQRAGIRSVTVRALGMIRPGDRQ
jgi:hypothetical protein